jgi:hypothetical protein
MSKYNLIDIFEQYRIGSGWTSDFDYEGMLNAGLKATLEDRIDSLEALAEDFTDVNYHREASHLYDALEALEKGDAFEAEGKISDFHAEIRKTMESFNMDMSDDLGAFMASKMDLKEEEGFVEVGMDEIKMHLDQYRSGKIDGDDLAQAIEEIVFGRISSPSERGFNTKYGMEESFDSLAKKLDQQKGIDKDEAAKIAGSIAAKKAAGAGKGPTAKQKKRMKEASDTFNIDKVASPDAKANDYGAEIKGISDEDDTEEKYAHQTVLPLEEIDPTLDPYEDRDEIIKQVMSLLIKEKGASKEELKGFIETHIEDILNAKDDDDVVDEFAQYLSVNEGDRELREHFGRFLKPYQ